MSLQFIIDGYNITNHPAFKKYANRKSDVREALADLISFRRLSGSRKNNVIIVFDGYPPSGYTHKLTNSSIEVIFSKDESADERIKKIIDRCATPKVMVVVSDDKEIKFSGRAAGVKVLGVDEFVTVEDKNMEETKLNYSQMHKINEELRKKWLREN